MNVAVARLLVLNEVFVEAVPTVKMEVIFDLRVLEEW